MNIIIEQSHNIASDRAGLVLIDSAASTLPLFQPSNFIDGIFRSDRINDADILKSCVFSQSLGMTHFHDIRDLSKDPIFREAVPATFSEATYRQRLDQLAMNDSVFDSIMESIIGILKKCKIKQQYYGGRMYYTLDIDVSPFLNPKTNKEGVERTYKNEDGYAPIIVYIDDYAVAAELRPGTQHSEDGAIAFFTHCLDILKKIGIEEDQILLRVDSAHDDGKFIRFCVQKGIKFIVKRNFRAEKQYLTSTKAKYAQENLPASDYFGGKETHYYFVDQNVKPKDVTSADVVCVYDVKRTAVETKSLPIVELTNEGKTSKTTFYHYELDGYWTNISINIKDYSGEDELSLLAKICIEAYHEHATSEQYHSEFKTDMKMELLPSGKFATDKLFLSLSVISFNILRLIGDRALEVDQQFFMHHKHEYLQRIRLATVIKKIFMIGCELVNHARKKVIKLLKEESRLCNIFAEINKLILNLS